MKKFTLSLLLMLIVSVVAACGGAPADGSAIVPGPDAPRLTPQTYLDNVADTDHFLVDVREPNEVSSTGVIPGAVNIPLSQLEARVSEVPTDTTVVVYCNSGNRSRTAATILANAGYTELLDLTGIQQWLRAGQQLVPLGL
jgi:rhodanese-related sulfurtransferase